jgi:hypothetical protein
MTIVISGEGKKMGEKVGQISVLFQYFIHFLNIWCEIKNQTNKKGKSKPQWTVRVQNKPDVEESEVDKNLGLYP